MKEITLRFWGDNEYSTWILPTTDYEDFSDFLTYDLSFTTSGYVSEINKVCSKLDCVLEDKDFDLPVIKSMDDVYMLNELLTTLKDDLPLDYILDVINKKDSMVESILAITTPKKNELIQKALLNYIDNDVDFDKLKVFYKQSLFKGYRDKTYEFKLTPSPVSSVLLDKAFTDDEIINFSKIDSDFTKDLSLRKYYLTQHLEVTKNIYLNYQDSPLAEPFEKVILNSISNDLNTIYTHLESTNDPIFYQSLIKDYPQYENEIIEVKNNVWQKDLIPSQYEDIKANHINDMTEVYKDQLPTRLVLERSPQSSITHEER